MGDQPKAKQIARAAVGRSDRSQRPRRCERRRDPMGGGRSEEEARLLWIRIAVDSLNTRRCQMQTSGRFRAVQICSGSARAWRSLCPPSGCPASHRGRECGCFRSYLLRRLVAGDVRTWAEATKSRPSGRSNVCEQTRVGRCVASTPETWSMRGGVRAARRRRADAQHRGLCCCVGTTSSRCAAAAASYLPFPPVAAVAVSS